MTLGPSLGVERAVIQGEIEIISPQHAPWRTNEYGLFASGAVAEWWAAFGTVAIGRDVQHL
jgi:hypothetical protein